MDEDGLLKDLKKVREKGVARTSWADVSTLRAAADGTSLEEFLRAASEQLDPFDTEGVRIALGIGGLGLGRNSADRRADFATHYKRTAETVRRRDGIEDQVFRRLAAVILRMARAARNAAPSGDVQVGASRFAAPDRVHVGRAPEVGLGYQRRGFDDEIDRLWADGGDRRVWLRGAPGLGKSFTARRVAQEADEQVVIWVESAGGDAVRAAFSEAAERMPHLGLTAEAGDPQRVHTQAENLLGAFESSEWSWLVVLDNADITTLIDARLVPTGRNRNGRLLVTAVGEDARMTHHGRIVRASLFTDTEAEEYLRTRVDARDGRRAALSGAPGADLSRLAEVVGHHPLALSTASATITANHQTIAEWIAEFERAPRMDDATEEPDAGGYPHAVGRTFRLALEKASAGVPEGVVERAAAVVAVQDAGGHPTWLWDRKDVRRWVAGEGDLDVRNGRPVVVKQLVAHGIVEVVGESWTGGRLAMHQLAARAVREAFSREELTRLGVILTIEWLANLVVDDAYLGPNMAALLENTGLEETPARIAAGGLAMFAHVLERDNDDSSFWRRQLARRLAEYSAAEDVATHLGPTSMKFMAGELGAIAFSFRKLGDADQAIRHADRAVAIYEEVVADPATTEVDRADALVALCRWYDAGGLDEQARARRQDAADRYERLLLTAGTPAERFDWVTRLATLAEELGDPAHAMRVRTRFAEAAELLAHTPTDAHDAFTHGARLEKLAAMQRMLGGRAGAERTLARSAEIYRAFGHDDVARDADLARLALVTEAGDWTGAELLTTQLIEAPDRHEGRMLADDLMRLASIRTHLPEPERAVEVVARAIEIYRESLRGDADEDDSDPDHEEDLGARGIRRLRLLGHLEHAAGRLDEAQQIFTRELDLLQDRAASGGGEFESELADTYSLLGVTAWELRRYREAADHLASAVRIQEILVGLTPGIVLQRKLAHALSVLASAQRHAGEAVKATDTLRRRLAVQATIVDIDPTDTEALTDHCDAMEQLAAHVAENGDNDEPIDILERSLRLRRALAEIVDTDTARVELAETLGLLGDHLVRAGRSAEADAAWVEQLSILESRDDRGELADALLAQGWRLGLAEDDRAATLIERGVRELEAIVAASPDDLKRTNRLAAAHLTLATLYDSRGDDQRLGAELAIALDLQTRVSAKDPGDLTSQALAAAAHAGLAEWLRKRDRLDDAVQHFAAASATFLLLLDLQFEMTGLAEQVISILHGYRDVLRILGRGAEADEVSSQIDVLESEHPEVDPPEIE